MNTTEADPKSRDLCGIYSATEWCSVGLHYASPVACVFEDPGDCMVYVCSECAQWVADKLKQPTPGDKA